MKSRLDCQWSVFAAIPVMFFIAQCLMPNDDCLVFFNAALAHFHPTTAGLNLVF